MIVVRARDECVTHMMVVCGDPNQNDHKKSNWVTQKTGIEQYCEMIEEHQKPKHAEAGTHSPSNP